MICLYHSQLNMEGDNMLDEEFYDPVVEELQGILKSIEELKELVSQQISIESANNFLLRKILESQFKNNLKQETINIDSGKYLKGNLLIINSSKDEGLRVAEMISSNLGGKLTESNAQSERELASLISGLSDGDILFVDITTPTFNNKMRTIITDCVKNKCMNILLGKGTTARNVCLDIAEIKFIIYTYMEDYLPNDLKDILIRIE